MINFRFYQKHTQIKCRNPILTPIATSKKADKPFNTAKLGGYIQVLHIVYSNFDEGIFP